MSDAEEPAKKPKKKENAGGLSDQLLRTPKGSPAPKQPAPPPAPVSGAPLETDPEGRQVLRMLRKQEQQAAARVQTQQAQAKRETKARQRLERDQQRIQQEREKHADYARKISVQLGLDPHRPVTDIPALPGPNTSQVELTTVLPERAYLRITFDQTTNRYLYECMEPKLTETEIEILELVRDTLVRTLQGRPAGDADEARAYLLDAVEQAILDHSILVDQVSKERIKYYIVRDFLGYGPVDILMRDPMIEDISCDGPNIPLYVFHRQYESIKTNVVFTDELDLDSFVIRLAQRSGKQISIADPLLDATMPDGSRLQCSLSKEVTTRGSSFTIRRFRGDPLTPPDLVRLGTMSPEMAAFYWLAMEEGMSVLVAGGTASGKTSTLNAVCTFIPPQKKIVSIEDTREINIPHENWIAGLTRAGFSGEVVGGKVAGTIDMYKLLEAALRQRPEYLLVGEVRGAEALTLFQAMATGHATYSTLHADSVQSAVYRLENPPINVPRIMLQTLGAISVQIQSRVNQRLVRRVKELVEVVGIDPETKDLLTNTVFTWDGAHDRFNYTGKSHILDTISTKRNWTHDQIDAELRNRTRIIEWMVEKGIRRIGDVVNVISGYYSSPQALLARIAPPAPAPPPAGGSRRGA